MTATIDRQALVGGLLEGWIEAGHTPERIRKNAAAVANFCEQVDALGGNPLELVKQAWEQSGGDKQAFLSSASSLVMPLVSGAGQVARTGLNTAGNAATAVFQKALDMSPYVLAASLAVPAGAGYLAGKGLGRMSDNGGDLRQDIHHRELLNALRDAAALARQQHQEQERRQGQLTY